MPTPDPADTPPVAAPPDTPAAPAPAAYANHFEVGYNAFEFLFDFGQDYEGAQGPVQHHTRIVTAPAYAKVFLGLLERSIGDYEASFGGIEQLPEPDQDKPV